LISSSTLYNLKEFFLLDSGEISSYLNTKETHIDPMSSAKIMSFAS
jgi:hypothetical protein